MYVIFRSVGPLLIIVVVNVCLATALNAVRRRRRRLLSNGARRARDNRANMTMMLIDYQSINQSNNQSISIPLITQLSDLQS